MKTFIVILTLCFLLFLWISGALGIQWNPLLTQVLTSNPGFLTTFITVFLVPIGVLVLTNSHQRSLKRLEKELAEKSDKERSHEKQQDLTYGALVNILFEVQQLYTELSIPNCSPACVDRALQRFKAKLFEHQTKISENQLYLKPKLIEQIYKFYSLLSALEIELTTLANESIDIRKACVSSNASKLADVVIGFHQGILLERDPDLVAEIFEMPNFKTCCGGPVSPDLLAEYERRIGSTTKPVGAANREQPAVPLVSKILPPVSARPTTAARGT